MIPDRQPHAQATGLGRVERLEDAREVRRRQPRTRIAYRDEHGFRVRFIRAHQQLARSFCDLAHHFDGVHDQVEDYLLHLSKPGQREIQAALLYDYRTNVASYPAWQAWLHEHKPPTLVIWGRNDPSFIAPGAEAFKRDLPNAEIHLLDAGHFALDEKNDEIARLILAFLAGHSD
jgi:pimeloyl-ACP methyl ester carboxylesterase